MTKIDFYFDFLSPYSYLATFRIVRLESTFHRPVAWHAINLEDAKAAIGNTRPPAHAQPIKLDWLKADLGRWASRYGAPLVFPEDLAFFDPAQGVKVARGFLWASHQNQGERYARAAFAALWGRGGRPGDAIVCEAARAAGLTESAALKAASSPEIIAEFHRENEQAHRRGVFGVPTFLVDDQLFWGNDRIEMLEEYLADPQLAVKL